MAFSYYQTVDCKDLDDALVVLGQIKLRVEHPQIPGIMEMCRKRIHYRTVKNFLDSEDPEGRPWAPVKRVGWTKVTPKPLIKTGLLFGSASAASASPDIHESQTEGKLAIDATTPFYGGFHITGTRNMVARVWLGVSDRMMDSMAEDAVEIELAWVLFAEVPP